MAKKTGGDKGSFGAFMKARVSQNKGKGLDSRLVAHQAERVVIGVPIKPLSAQILHGADVDPLGRMSLYAGDSTAGKSAFSWEKGRWYLECDEEAGVDYIQNEPRDSPDYRRSIFTDQYIQRVISTPTATVEEWQIHMTDIAKNLETTFRGRKGCAWPAIIILDSTTGTPSQRTIDDINKKGHASPSFPIVANLIDQYLHVILERLRHWPISLVFTNHLKWGQHPQNPQLKVHRIVGGAALMFYSTYVFMVSRGREISRGKVGGYSMNIKTLKMFGQGNRSVSVEVLWWNEPGPDGQPRQKTVFDWHSATIDHIIKLPAEKFREVEDIIQFQVVNQNARSATCHQLGIKKPEPYAKVGEAIMADEKLRVALQDYFAVKRRSAFRPGVPYDEQIADAIKAGSIDNQAPTQVESATDEEDVAILSEEDEVPADEAPEDDVGTLTDE